MKVLNLFAGIGGNRTLWGDEHEITAVEYNQQIAMIYYKRFPKDKVIIGDAYEYLRKNMDNFDFIWASPPCPTHSKLNSCNIAIGKSNLPDMRLYSIIIYLYKWFKGVWVVENVEPYYSNFISLKVPFIKIFRHYFWSNIIIDKKIFKRKYPHVESNIQMLKEEYLAEDVDLYKGYEERKMLRNCVKPELGKYILDCVINKKQVGLEVFL